MEMKTIQTVIDKLVDLAEAGVACDLNSKEIGELLRSQEEIEKQVPIRHQLDPEKLAEIQRRTAETLVKQAVVAKN